MNAGRVIWQLGEVNAMGQELSSTWKEGVGYFIHTPERPHAVDTIFGKHASFLITILPTQAFRK